MSEYYNCTGLIDAISDSYSIINANKSDSFHKTYKIDNLTTDGRKYDKIIIDKYTNSDKLIVKLMTKSSVSHIYELRELGDSHRELSLW